MGGRDLKWLLPFCLSTASGLSGALWNLRLPLPCCCTASRSACQLGARPHLLQPASLSFSNLKGLNKQ